MTLSTVNALAASARAYLARAVNQPQARSPDAPGAVPDARSHDDAGSRGDRKAVVKKDTAQLLHRQARPRDSDTSVHGDRKAVPHDKDTVVQRDREAASHRDAVSSSHRKTASRGRATDEPQDDDGLDTGVLVTRFFDVLQAAAQAGGGSPTRAADGDVAATDAAFTAGEGSTLGAPDGTGSPLDGAAMAMPWARSWATHEAAGGDPGSALQSIGLRGASVSSPDALDADLSGAVDTTAGAAGTSSSATAAGEADASGGTSSASTSASTIIAGAWPLYGPPASRPSARGADGPSARQVDRASVDLAGAASTSNASPVDASLAAGDGVVDRLHRTNTASSAEPSGQTDAGGPSVRSVDALWPWPSTTGTAASAPGALSLPAGAPAQWREALSQALGDRLQLTLGQGGDQAVIRLDPPMLGRIDLAIRQDGAMLTVHLSASNPEVLRQLHAMGDGLRQDLSHRHAGDLTVTVAHQPSRAGTDADPRQHRSPRDDDADAATPGRALAEADPDGSGDPRHARRTASFASLTRTFGAP